MSHPNLDDAFPERRRDFSVPSRAMLLSIVGFITGVVLSFTAVTPGAADRQLIERGKYLVTLGGCTDCHTPGYFFGKPDPARQLGGSEVGFEIAGLGCFTGRT